MTTIPADATNFWNRFVADISQLVPEQDQKGSPEKIVEEYFGLKKNMVEKTFHPKNGNYQNILSDEEMLAFNEGHPLWDFKRVLLAKLLWFCTHSNKCKALGMDWREFESKINSVLSPDRTDVENWQAGLRWFQEIEEKLAHDNDTFDKLKERIYATAAHFVGKITHSSVSNGAIIVHPESNPYPYLYSTSIGLTPAELDRSTGQNNDANTLKHCKEIWERTKQNKTEEVSDVDQLITKLFEQILSDLGSGEKRKINSFVDYRLKQLKIPKGSEYVVITPLAAAGISKRITDQKNASFDTKITLDIGGANFINVSEFKQVKNAFVYNAPNVTKNHRVTATSIVHKGFYLDKNKKMTNLVDQYCSWLGKNSFVYDRNSYLASKIEWHHSTLQAIVESALEQHDNVANDIQHYISTLIQGEDSKIFIEKLKQMGLIERSFVERPSFGIASTFARMILELIDGHTFKEGNRFATCNLSTEDRSRLQENIQKMLSRIKGWS